jgi:hypothetical protein
MRALKNQTMILLDRHSRAKYWPLGPSTTKEIVTPAGSRAVVTPQPMVQFESNIYRCKDPKIAVGMVNDTTNFQAEWGYHIDPDCLPDKVKELWHSMPVVNKRKVALALIAGKGAKEALEAMDPSLNRSEEEMAEPNPAQKHSCPVCGDRATGKNPQAALKIHMEMYHPEADPRQLLNA